MKLMRQGWFLAVLVVCAAGCASPPAKTAGDAPGSEYVRFKGATGRKPNQAFVADVIEHCYCGSGTLGEFLGTMAEAYDVDIFLEKRLAAAPVRCDLRNVTLQDTVFAVVKDLGVEVRFVGDTVYIHSAPATVVPRK